MQFEVFDPFELFQFFMALAVDKIAIMVFLMMFTFLILYFAGLFWGFYTFYMEEDHNLFKQGPKS